MDYLKSQRNFALSDSSRRINHSLQNEHSQLLKEKRRELVQCLYKYSKFLYSFNKKEGVYGRYRKAGWKNM